MADNHMDKEMDLLFAEMIQEMEDKNSKEQANQILNEDSSEVPAPQQDASNLRNSAFGSNQKIISQTFGMYDQFKEELEDAYPN